jgi:hypothetical protein
MKTVLLLAFSLMTFSAFAGGGGTQETICYGGSSSKGTFKSFTFPGDVRFYKLGQTVEVSLRNMNHYSEEVVTLSRLDNRTFEFTSENSSIIVHQKTWFLSDVTIESVIDGETHADEMVCDVN